MAALVLGPQWEATRAQEHERNASTRTCKERKMSMRSHHGSQHGRHVISLQPSVGGDKTELFTVDDVLDRCGVGGAHHWLLLVYTGVSWGSFAIQTLVLSFLGSAVECEWGTTVEQQALLTSLTFVGAHRAAQLRELR